MSKRAYIAALKAFPPKFTSPKRYAKRVQSEKVDTHAAIRRFYQEAYEQAEKDVWERIEKYLSERNPTDYATVGWILKNIEEYKNKIMEEE